MTPNDYYNMGKLPDKFYFQMVNSPQRAYDTQRKKNRKGQQRRNDPTFIEKFLRDLSAAEISVLCAILFQSPILEAFIQRQVDEIIDRLNGNPRRGR